MALNGKYIIIKRDGQAIGYVKSQEQQSQADLNEVYNPTQDDWRHFKPGRNKWAVNVGWIIGVSDQIYELLNVGTKYQLQLVDSDGEGVEGYAYMTECHTTFKRSSIINGSFKFTGTGPLSLINNE